jgi:hypothetical protein
MAKERRQQLAKPFNSSWSDIAEENFLPLNLPGFNPS